MVGDSLQIASDDDDPLVFEAADPKPLGTDFAATNVTISFTSAFMPYSLAVLPLVPKDAKGAVILVTEEEDPDEAPGGEFYYAAYDPDSDANVWKPSGVTAATNDFVDVVMLISHGAQGFINVKYAISGKSMETVPFKQSDANVHDVVYSGMGQARELKSEFKNVDPYRIGETVVMQLNDTLPAESTLPLELSVKSVSGTLSGEDCAHVFIGEDKWAWDGGQWRKMDLVTMNFYYPGYLDRDKVTLRGLSGDKIEEEELDLFLVDVEEADYVQKFYWDAETETIIDYVYWFDGTWRDAGDNTVEFPTHYVAGDFYPNSTAIVFSITYDMGEATGVTNPNPTGYDINSRFGLGDASATGLGFVRWEDEKGNEVTEINAIALGQEAGTLDDITLYAVWEPAKLATVKLKSVTVSPGGQAAYYDTPEAAQSAATAFNDDKADSMHGPRGFTGDMAGYAANFKAAANGTAMSVVLTEEAAAKIAERLNNDVLVAAELADPTVATVTVTDAEPGFYYSIVGGATLGSITTEGVRKLAQGSTVELEKPDLGETGSAFYRIRATVK